MSPTNPSLLGRQQQTRLYWYGLVLYFLLFSFNALSTSIIAALIGAKWEVLSGQERFLIIVAIAANWTGLVIVFLQKSMGRMLSGKSPIETGDTSRFERAPTA